MFLYCFYKSHLCPSSDTLAWSVFCQMVFRSGQITSQSLRILQTGRLLLYVVLIYLLRIGLTLD